jgi:hypothetical protein
LNQWNIGFSWLGRLPGKRRETVQLVEDGGPGIKWYSIDFAVLWVHLNYHRLVYRGSRILPLLFFILFPSHLKKRFPKIKKVPTSSILM